MENALAQLADLDGWFRWLLIAVAISPVAVLALIIAGGLFGWLRDPKKIWTDHK